MRGDIRAKIVEINLELDYPNDMLSEYIKGAMRKAKYEILDDNEGYYGEIPGFQGVYSNARTLEECRNLLQEVLEEWIFLNIADNTPLPRVAGVKLASFKRREMAVS